MDTCACGNPASLNGTTCRRCDALHELGLKAGATDAEVKAAHRLYVKAWHPDRFPGDEKSKNAAQEKLKSINSAYEFLSSPSSKNGQPYRPKAATPPAQPQEPSQQKKASEKKSPPAGRSSQEPPPKPNTGGGQAPPRPPNSGPPPPPARPQYPPQPGVAYSPQRLGWTVPPSLKPWLRAVGFACALGFSRLLWQAFDTKPTENAYTKAYDQQRTKALRDLNSPKELTIPLPPTAPMKAKPLGEFDGKGRNSGKNANPQGGSFYDFGKQYYNQKDYVDARFVFTLACDSGEMKACNYLGYLYAQGLGGDQDRDKARDVYQRACDQGTLSSCASLGSLYQDVGNTDEARRYFQKACKGGVAESCKLLRGAQ